MLLFHTSPSRNSIATNLHNNLLVFSLDSHTHALTSKTKPHSPVTIFRWGKPSPYFMKIEWCRFSNSQCNECGFGFGDLLWQRNMPIKSNVNSGTWQAYWRGSFPRSPAVPCWMHPCSQASQSADFQGCGLASWHMGHKVKTKHEKLDKRMAVGDLNWNFWIWWSCKDMHSPLAY